MASQVALVVKNLSANAGYVRDVGSTPRFGRSPGGGHGNPLQYSCLENPMDRGAWQATVHEVAKSGTRLKRLSTRSTHARSLATTDLSPCSFAFESISQEWSLGVCSLLSSLLSLRMIHMRFIHALVCISGLFLFMTEEHSIV